MKKNILNIINLTFAAVWSDGREVRVPATYRFLSNRKIGLREAQNIVTREKLGPEPVAVSVESFVV